MIRQRSGHIINTSLIAGRKVFPGLAVYCATKHAIAALSEGLRRERSWKHNVRVTCIQPGAVESELFEHISDANSREQMEKLKDEMTVLVAADKVSAPLIQECYANFECRLADTGLIRSYGLFVWDVVKAHVARSPKIR